jgi:hypothetical protein
MTTTNRDTVALEHTIGAHGRLTIHLATAELRLAGTDGDRVVIRTPNGATLNDRVVVETTEGEILIRQKDRFGLGFSQGQKIAQLEIEVPAGAEVAADTASGWVDAQGLTGQQRYRTASGDIRLREVAGRIELNTASGDATIELAGAADLVLKSVSGDVAVSGGRLDSLRISTTSGDIRIDSPLTGRTGNAIETLSGDVMLLTSNGIRVDARTVSGDLTSDLPHRSEGRMGRRALIVGDGSIELGFRSVSGDLRIHDGTGQRARTRPIPLMPPFPPMAPEMPEMPEMPELPEMPNLADLLRDVGNAGRADEAIALSDDEDTTLVDAVDPLAADDTVEAERMTILRALESGDLDVATAMDRLAALDAAGGKEDADG